VSGAVGLADKRTGGWRARLAAWTAWTRRPAVRAAVVVLALCLVGAHAASPWGQLLIRVDESWPYHRVFWLARSDGPYERGAYVAYRFVEALGGRLRPPEAREREYVRYGQLYLKRVLGVPGDRVETRPVGDGRDGRVEILINGQPVGHTLGRDRLGRPIEPGPLPSPIPSGMYYVALSHPRSFDSRYIGYVPEALIEGEVRFLW
jgi:conjugal transfer pilin signal peptidase TrbI